MDYPESDFLTGDRFSHRCLELVFHGEQLQNRRPLLRGRELRFLWKGSTAPLTGEQPRRKPAQETKARGAKGNCEAKIGPVLSGADPFRDWPE